MAVLIIGFVLAQTAAAATHYFTPVRHQRGVLVFKLTGVQPSEIRAAYLKASGRHRAVSIRRVRAGARRGVLRLRVSGHPRCHKSHRRHSHQAPTIGATLVIVTSDPSTTTPTEAIGNSPQSSVETGTAPAPGPPSPSGDNSPPTTPTGPVQTGPRYPIRGVYDRDFSATGFDDLTAVGFNYIDTNPYKYQLDALVARGLKGFVWLGGYNDDPAVCNFNYDDTWVRNHIAGDATHPSIVGNPGVGAYFIDDEPNDSNCPNAPSQIKARSDLVKSLDPGKPTLMVHYENFATWAGKTDILGLDHYPCSIENGCDYSKIDAEAAEADRLGIRYWGVIQAYGDGASASCGSSPWYRLPTPDELHQEFVHWSATNMEGYLVFAWHWPACDPSVWLANHPELQAQLALENAS
jgi:hypothetical protein